MAVGDLDTGNGATVTFGTSSYSWAVTSIDPPEFSRGTIDKSTLSTTGFTELIKQDLTNVGPMTIEGLFKRGEYPDISAVAETITATWPNSATTAANMAGTAFLTSFKAGALVNNELQRFTAVVQYDGVTGPTFTAEA